MTGQRHAQCQCGQLRATVRGEPVRVSVCHCLDCQRRSGSVFAMQARYAAEDVGTEGTAREWARRGDKGAGAVFSFCPDCGSTVHYRLVDYPGFVTIPVGAFADPQFPAPGVSVYEERKHAWVSLPADIERHD
ncbi:GFA family protein [Novosphingobium sp. 9U]|uniref:GFA family protein n=1 Tax=Novosphingobium sp. 9U TaxID=2653158 RepID=UPI0012F2AEB9|nr:GFA family protein [Novosphingobium sp. 9U]VWX53278.1 Aldehyde-activating protein [Novosphingobium sp. 9U]